MEETEEEGGEEVEEVEGEVDKETAVGAAVTATVTATLVVVVGEGGRRRMKGARLWGGEKKEGAASTLARM